MKLTVKNIGKNPTLARTLSGPKDLPVGATITDDFSDAEAAQINGNKVVYETTGYVDPGPEALKEPSVGSIQFRDENGDTAEMAQMRRMFDSSFGAQGQALETARAQLADIAALFGSDVKPEEVKDKIAVLLAQPVIKGDAGTGFVQVGDTKKPTLAEAVASLDDKNDAQWTQGGKPDLATLAALTGGDVKRADVDALTPARERKTA